MINLLREVIYIYFSYTEKKTNINIKYFQYQIEPKSTINRRIKQILETKTEPNQNHTNYFLKLLSKIIAPKIITLQIYIPKRFTAILQSCSQKLLPQVTIFQNNYSKKLFRKACQNCSPKRLPEAASQNISTTRLPQTDYTSNLFPETIPQSYSPKRLPKVAPQSCCRKLLPKVAFKSYSPKVLPIQSCCSKLPCKAAPQTCSTKLFPKAFPKVVIGSEQLLKLPPKVVSESGFPKLLSKVTPQSPKLSFFKATVRQCCCKAAKLLPTVAPQS